MGLFHGGTTQRNMNGRYEIMQEYTIQYKNICREKLKYTHRDKNNHLEMLEIGKEMVQDFMATQSVISDKIREIDLSCA